MENLNDATENLSTMISISQPTKSDVISLGHSINVGADLTLSEETAISSEYRNIITWLINFLKIPPYISNLTKGTIWKDKGDLMWSVIDISKKISLLLFHLGQVKPCKVLSLNL